MKYEVFTIRDEVIGYGMPMAMDNEAAAVRECAQLVNNKESRFAFHPMDYALYRIAYYDTDTGILSDTDPVRICGFIDLVRSE